MISYLAHGDGGTLKLAGDPASGGAAWRLGVIRGMSFQRKTFIQAQENLAAGRAGKLTFQSRFASRCACVSLAFNCKMDIDQLETCSADVGDEASKTSVAKRRETFVRHWSGESKPWSHWWDNVQRRPKNNNVGGKALSKSQMEGVWLWWRFHDEMKQFVKDFHSKPEEGK